MAGWFPAVGVGMLERKTKGWAFKETGGIEDDTEISCSNDVCFALYV